MGKRSTQAELHLRRNTVYGMLADGASRASIVQFAAETWNVTERQADTYIKDARLLIEKECDLSRPAFLAESLAGLRAVRLAASRRGQHQVVVNAIRLQAELVGLTGSKTA